MHDKAKKHNETTPAARNMHHGRDRPLSQWARCEKDPEKLAEFRQWAFDTLKRANTGDREALAELAQECSQWPEDILDKFTDLTKIVQAMIFRKMFPDQDGSRLLMQEKVDRLRAALFPAGGDRLEKLLVEVVVMCWAQVHRAELEEVRGQSELSDRPEMLRYLSSCTDRAYRRLLSAARTLAVVRKLTRSNEVGASFSANDPEADCITTVTGK
ncbi:MAG TPA: hypothetical protein EYP56_07210 [Planctomycetaceae bacterium]|nr:hypothetical protein [Planctomycetaceae bacterium]